MFFFGNFRNCMGTRNYNNILETTGKYTLADNTRTRTAPRNWLCPPPPGQAGDSGNVGAPTPPPTSLRENRDWGRGRNALECWRKAVSFIYIFDSILCRLRCAAYYWCDSDASGSGRFSSGHYISDSGLISISIEFFNDVIFAIRTFSKTPFGSWSNGLFWLNTLTPPTRFKPENAL